MVTTKNKKIQLSGNKKTYLERTGSLNIYYNYVRQHKPLSKEKTKELFKQYHNGSQKEKELAFNTIFSHNMGLVISLARDYCSNDDNLNDLIQEGNIGLMKAIEMFDEENGTSFAGYSMYWIRRYINIFKTNMTPVVTQTNRSKTANVIITITNDLHQKLERVPTPDEILDEYNIRYPKKPLKDTDDLVNVEYVFIDKFNQSNENVQNFQEYFEYQLASQSHNDYIFEARMDHNKVMVSDLLDGLTEKEKKVISMLYGLGKGIGTSVSTISSEMGVSTQRVNQLHKTALRKMKAKSEKLSYSFK